MRNFVTGRELNRLKTFLKKVGTCFSIYLCEISHAIYREKGRGRIASPIENSLHYIHVVRHDGAGDKSSLQRRDIDVDRRLFTRPRRAIRPSEMRKDAQRNVRAQNGGLQRLRGHHHGIAATLQA